MTCSACGIDKPIKAFYPKRGRQCRLCINKANAAYYHANRDRMLEHGRKIYWENRKKEVARKRRYNLTNRERHVEYTRRRYSENVEKCREQNRASYLRHLDRRRAETRAKRQSEPEKVRARDIANYEVKAGRLLKQPCHQCGSPRAQKHHPDYSQPLLIEWLCSMCHGRTHRRTTQHSMVGSRP